ncbi:hypothetical protein K439DRAFT_1634534 [Ramaria rubella]|nr:hypothetical protein K439DRAFT_1634534 [Ramaria rubella]
MAMLHRRGIDDLSDEIISLIIYQLGDPASLSMTSKRLHRISKDPYVRSSYFLARYGPQQAFYWALSRGKLMNERVLDILLTSGAHLSRYLLQTAIHHYFRTTAHFIKHPWARTLPLPVFTHFMNLGRRFGADVPLAKGEDDGSVFLGWLKERVSPGFGKKVGVEAIKGLFEKYGFMVFAPKDPVAAQFPLAFALEPSLLPLAVANGFRMDSKYRDFIFRKMFEKHNREGRVVEIMKNVREMTRLDETMFLSRTVAAEVCMECRTNEAGYLALKRLDDAGDLLFELRDLVNDLLKLFLKTRSITAPNTVLTLQSLYRDFSPAYCSPSPRLVMLITVFCTSPTCGLFYVDTTTPPGKLSRCVLKAKLEHLGVLPLTRTDLVEIMTSPWCEKPTPVFTWAKEEMGMNDQQIQALAEEVAVRCLGVSSKGKLVRRLADTYSTVRENIASAAKLYRVNVESLPDYWADDDCDRFRTGLNAVFGQGSSDMYSMWAADKSGGEEQEDDSDNDFLLDDLSDDEVEEDRAPEEEEEEEKVSKRELGLITQDSLTGRIQLDMDNNLRPRRRYWSTRYISQPDSQLKLSYPFDALPIGRWVLDSYGPRHPVTAVFMTHAITNQNVTILQYYLEDDMPRAQHVPVTLKHFKIMAKLGREPFWQLWREIEHVEFFLNEDDYLDPSHRLSDNASSADTSRPGYGVSSTKVELKTPELEGNASSNGPAYTPILSDSPNPRKRPRRSVANAAPSYIIPDSDDEAIAEENVNFDYQIDRKGKGKAKVESSLQVWIKHLTALLKEEEKKYKEKKKTIEKKENGKPKYRLPKSDFMKSLAAHLRDMRITERQRRSKDTFYRRGKLMDMDSDFDSLQESDDDEYVLRQPKAKKRRAEVSRVDGA